MEGADYLEIQNLYARYTHCADQGDAEGWAACFTMDGSIDLVGRNIVVSGRQNLAEFQRQSSSRRGASYRRHLNCNLLVEMSGPDAAKGRCYFQAFNGRAGEALILTDAGIYEDSLQRNSSGWLIVRRTVHFDPIKAPG